MTSALRAEPVTIWPAPTEGGVRSRSASDQRPLHAAPTVRAAQCSKRQARSAVLHEMAWNGLEPVGAENFAQNSMSCRKPQGTLSQRGSTKGPLPA